MYLLILALPLTATFITLLFGRFLGGAGATRLTVTTTAIAALLSLFAFYEVALCQSPTVLRLAPWRTTDSFTLSWGFLFDSLTVVRLVVVTSISTLVHLYSTSYRSEDPHLPRFRAYLSLFTFFRLVLVTADNFLQRFVGWEGVGLASYLLISFWYSRLQANKAAIKARVLNRVGDRGLSLALFLILATFGTLDYAPVFALAPAFADSTFPIFAPLHDILPPFLSGLLPSASLNLLDLIAFLLLFGAVGKSAQVGLQTWLPDAREGPTPVSALIHAATRVTAGIVLLCRCSPLIEYAPHLPAFLTLLGGCTAFLAATTGLLQNDLKRVIAYSTCSQLGYRLFAVGLAGYPVARFHLSNHAFFKALLFLGAGSVIHARGDEQDRRKRGGLVRLLPFTYAARRVGSLALRGFPFLAGFYSKDLILELAYGSYTVPGRFVHTLGSLAAFFTAFYSTRLVGLAFLGAPNSAAKGSRILYASVHEAPLPRAIPLFLLSFASIAVGYVTRDRRVGLGTDFWGTSLFLHPDRLALIDAEWIPTSVKLFPLVLSLSGVVSAFFLYTQRPTLLFALQSSPTGRALYTFLNRQWFFNKVYAEWIAAPLLRVAYHHTYQGRDRGILERFGPHGLATEISRSLAALNPTSLATSDSPSLAALFRRLISLLAGLTFTLVLLTGWTSILPLLDLPVTLGLLPVLALVSVATVSALFCLLLAPILKGLYSLLCLLLQFLLLHCLPLSSNLITSLGFHLALLTPSRLFLFFLLKENSMVRDTLLPSQVLLFRLLLRNFHLSLVPLSLLFCWFLPFSLSWHHVFRRLLQLLQLMLLQPLLTKVPLFLPFLLPFIFLQVLLLPFGLQIFSFQPLLFLLTLLLLFWVLILLLFQQP
jgi:NADH-ubiquinone oxidoreductase chain 5